MGTEYLRSVHGIITSLQVFFGLAALFASSFIWNNTNVYIQLGYKGYGWQTLVVAFLLFTWFIAVGILIMQATGRDFIGQLGKFKLLIIYGVCCGLLIIASSLEAWYSKKSHDDDEVRSLLHPRFVIVTQKRFRIGNYLSRTTKARWFMCTRKAKVLFLFLHVSGAANSVHWQFVVVGEKVFGWLLVVSYVILILVTLLFS